MIIFFASGGVNSWIDLKDKYRNGFDFVVEGERERERKKRCYHTSEKLRCKHFNKQVYWKRRTPSAVF